MKERKRKQRRLTVEEQGYKEAKEYADDVFLKEEQTYSEDTDEALEEKYEELDFE